MLYLDLPVGRFKERQANALPAVLENFSNRYWRNSHILALQVYVDTTELYMFQSEQYNFLDIKWLISQYQKLQMSS